LFIVTDFQNYLLLPLLHFMILTLVPIQPQLRLKMETCWRFTQRESLMVLFVELYVPHCNFQAPSQNCEKRLLASSRLAVRQYATTRLPLEGFSWNWIFEYFYIFRKSFEKIQALLKSEQNNGHFVWRPNIQLWSYLAKLVLIWEMFQTNFVEEIKTHILCLVTFSRKSCRLWENVGRKYGRDVQYGAYDLRAGKLILQSRSKM
jgi:hypothetical protein